MSSTRTPATPTPPNTPPNDVVLPPGSRRRAAARRPGTLVVRPEIPPTGALSRRQIAALPALGQRLLVLGEGNQQWITEIRRLAQDLATAAPDGSRARIASLANEVTEVLEWCDESQAELQAEARAACDGLQAVDLLGLCDDVLHDRGPAGEGREIRLLGNAVHTVWGSIEALGELVRIGIELVDARTGGLGDIAIEVGEDAGGPFVRIQGLGRGRLEPAECLVEAFRRAALAAGAEVRPDATSDDGAGLVIAVAAERRGPVVPRA
jgi:hypothetical protein